MAYRDKEKQRECQRQWMASPQGKASRMRHYFANRDAWRNTRYKNYYGITLAEYNQMLANQNERCPICERHVSELKRRLHVDHDHKTGRVRGLICEDCNVALGRLRDNARALSNGIRYLEGQSRIEEGSRGVSNA